MVGERRGCATSDRRSGAPMVGTFSHRSHGTGGSEVVRPKVSLVSLERLKLVLLHLAVVVIVTGTGVRVRIRE